MPAQEPWSAPPAALLLARQDRILRAVAEHLLVPALLVLPVPSAVHQVRHIDFTIVFDGGVLVVEGLRWRKILGLPRWWSGEMRFM